MEDSMTAHILPPFPIGMWADTEARFMGASPPGAPVKAAIVFAIYKGQFLLGDIEGRGWCIPGGRLETGETPEAAVIRETWEEVGARLFPVRLLGWFVLTHSITKDIQSVPTYVARVAQRQPPPGGTESRGVRLVSRRELPDVYYMWDPLLAAVFDYALLQCPDG